MASTPHISVTVAILEWGGYAKLNPEVFNHSGVGGPSGLFRGEVVLHGVDYRVVGWDARRRLLRLESTGLPPRRRRTGPLIFERFPSSARGAVIGGEKRWQIVAWDAERETLDLILDHELFAPELPHPPTSWSRYG